MNNYIDQRHFFKDTDAQFAILTEYGPAFSTTNASAMIHQLSLLTADGGGDEPELGYHGIVLALENVRPRSTCNLFTDAPAKDTELYPQAMVMKLRTQTEVKELLEKVVVTDLP